MSPAPLCFIDTETTGVHPGREVWEVGMIRREPSGLEQAIQFFVDVDLRQADPFGLGIGRFYERHPMGRYLAMDARVQRTEHPGGAPTYTDFANDTYFYDREHAARVIARATHGAHLVGAVPSFDAATLDPLLRAHGYLPAWHYHLIDVEALMVGVLAALAASLDSEPVVPGAYVDHVRAGDTAFAEKVRAAMTAPWSSRELALLVTGLEQPLEEQHTALGDARFAMQIYDAVMGGRA